MSEGNGDRIWQAQRHKILFFAGLLGMFLYLVLTEFLKEPFHYEWLIGFCAMMGVGILQGVEKK